MPRTTAACRGMAGPPFPSPAALMKPFHGGEKRGFLIWVYLDDILFVNPSVKALLQHCSSEVAFWKTSANLGLSINLKKSILRPIKEVDYR